MPAIRGYIFVQYTYVHVEGKVEENVCNILQCKSHLLGQRRKAKGDGKLRAPERKRKRTVCVLVYVCAACMCVCAREAVSI